MIIKQFIQERFRIFIFLVLIILMGYPGAVHCQEAQEIIIGGSMRDMGASIIQDDDGKLVICGTSRSYGNGSDDMILVKVDLEGQVIFQKVYRWDHQAKSRWIEQTNDGNYVIFGELWDGGYGREDMFLMKVNQSGEKIWEQYYGGYHTDQGFCVRALDDGFIALGYTSSQPETTRGNFYLVRTDLDGNKLWENNYGTEFLDFGFCVLPTPSGEFCLLGAAGGFFNPARADYLNPDSDMLLIKTDQDGNEISRYYFGGILHDWGKDMILSEDGSMFLFGSTQSTGSGSFDMYLIKLDQGGNKVWEKTYGGSDFEYGSAISIDPAGNLYLLGTKQLPDSDQGPDIFLVKTTSGGDVLWEQTFGGIGSDYGHDLVSMADSGCVLVGEIENIQSGKSDIYIVRLDKSGNILGFDVPPDSLITDAIKFYPNPVENNATIEWKGLPPQGGYRLSVYSLSGELLQYFDLGSEKKIQLELAHLPSGTYLYQVLYKENQLSGKFINR